MRAIEVQQMKQNGRAQPETEEEKQRRNRLKALRYALVFGGSWLAYKIIRWIVKGGGGNRRQRLLQNQPYNNNNSNSSLYNSMMGGVGGVSNYGYGSGSNGGYGMSSSYYSPSYSSYGAGGMGGYGGYY